MWLVQYEKAVFFPHTALLFDGKRSFIHCLTISCVTGGGVLEGDRVNGQGCQSWRGTELALCWWWTGVGGRGNHCLAVTACRSGGTTSQWLLSCPYYAKTCILEGAWFGVESRRRTRHGRTNQKTPAPRPGQHVCCICIIVFESHVYVNGVCFTFTKIKK